MAGEKYLKVGAAGFPEEAFSAQTSAGVADANKIAALDATGKLDTTMMPSGLGADSVTATAGEAIAAGDLVYITATGTIMKADANAVAKAAIGFCNVAIANAQPGTVLFEGSITGKSGLTPGAWYFLSGTATGAVVLAAGIPTANNSIVQSIGVATSATTISFEASKPIVRAA